MSVARDIEAALKAAMAAELTTLPRLWIRASRDQRKALPDNGPASGAAFPQILIAVSPKYYTNAFATLASDITIRAATHIDDDPDGSAIADIEDALERFFDTFTPCAPNAAFSAAMLDARPSWNYGGFLPEPGGAAPTEQDAERTMMLQFTIHYSLD